MRTDRVRSHSSDLDLIRRSAIESPAFNRAWLLDGKQLSWLQRLGFAVFSLLFFGIGQFADTTLIGALLQATILSPEGALDICLIALATLIFLVPGIIGLQNVVRF